MSDFEAKHFYNETIEVQFNHTPLLQKKSGCPSSFVWRGSKYKIKEIISEWHKYHRRGRMSRNMQPRHAEYAEKRGSWGVGQDYFRVRCDSSQIFDIYYDRAPKDVNNRKGSWFIYRELEEHSA